MVSAQSQNSHKKLQEILLVSLSDTVINPRTVVVHPPDAVLADPAVVGPGGAVHLALSTDGPVLLGCNTAPLAVAVGEVYTVGG